MSKNMNEFYVIVSFNTEEYDPKCIANVSDVYTTFAKALEGLSCDWDDIVEEEDEGSWKYDRTKGTLIRDDGHKGFYIEKVYINF